MNQRFRRIAPVLALAVAGTACGSRVVLSFVGPDAGSGGAGGSSSLVEAGLPDGGGFSGTVQRVTTIRPSQIDLLFMIDNSSSMADKQTILARAVPDLVNRLVNPVCIDRTTGMQVGVRNPDGSCSVGEPEFDPLQDIHIGIIDSSLGSHGAAGVCVDAQDWRIPAFGSYKSFRA